MNYDEKSQEFVRQKAGRDEGHPQTDVELLRQLRLEPHEQTGNTNTVNSNKNRYTTEKRHSLLYFLQDVGHFPKDIL